VKRPLGVTLISYFYIFGAFILLFTSIFYDANANQIGIAARFGLSNVSEQFVRVVVAIVSFIMIFGYMRLKKWGFWLMIAYSVAFGGISLALSISKTHQPFIGNMVWSIMVLSYTLFVNKVFFQKNIIKEV
jgi:hypothetical protein